MIMRVFVANDLIPVGGTPETQREFIASLDTVTTPTPSSRNQASNKPPIANEFALGYTYQDVLDTDQQDILARLSIYTLSKPTPHFIPLLRPLFSPKTIPNMLLVILLDWSDPWNWITQLRSWVRLLHTLLQTLPKDTVPAFEDNIIEWRDKKRNDSKDTSGGTDGATSSIDADVELPLGPGEWDSPLGVPLCVVCQNANKIESLEKESGWRDAHFDFVQQFLRTILLKHGGSLIYTMPHLAGTGTGSALQTLVHSSLGIQSMLQKKTLSYNMTDRESILVPPNFDSWGKIRILTDDFNAEAVSQAWTEDIGSETQDDTNAAAPTAAAMYGEFIRNPRGDIYQGVQQKAQTGIEVDSKDVQLFLSEQAEKLDGLAKDDERQLVRDTTRKTSSSVVPPGGNNVQEHIGTVQFNVGGIQMDVDQALRQLNVRISPLPRCTTRES
jgi:dynein light intermediate chain 1